MRQEWPCLAQLSDPHIPAEGALRNGIDAAERLSAAVQWILMSDLPISGCLVTGDLVDLGTEAEYRRLRAILDPLQAVMPVFLVLGNHDARAPLCEVFGDYPGVVEARDLGWLQYSAPIPGGGQVVVLDSLEPGLDGGLLCDGRLDWLEHHLSHSGRPTILAVHHPAVAIGNAVFDAMRLERPDRLMQVIQRHAAVTPIELVLHGHVHRAIATQLAGIPVWVGPSTAYPYSLTYSRATRGSPLDEPSALSVHLKPALGAPWVSHAVGLKPSHL